MNFGDRTRVKLDKLVDLGLMCVLWLYSTALLLVEGSLDVAPKPENEELNEGPESVELHDVAYNRRDVLKPL